MAAVGRLWRGEAPLAVAFWDYAIIGGVAVNLGGLLLALAVATMRAPDLLVTAAYVAPVPYNLFAARAVWLSAARHPGRREWAVAARVAIVPWTVLACLV